MMNFHSLQVLEYEKIKEIIADFTLSPLGGERALTAAPVDDRALIERWLDETMEMVCALESGDLPSMSGIRDIRDHLTSAGYEGAILPAQALLEVARLLDCAVRLKTHFDAKGNDGYQRLRSLAEGITPVEEVAKEIGEKILPEGEIRDEASRTLASIRKRIISTERLLEERINQCITLFSRENMLQITQATIRNNRPVLPVKSNFKKTVKGIIHDRSASGETVYIEPLAIVDVNNRIGELRLEEKKEIEKILKILTAMIRERLEDIRRDVSILQDFDYLYGKAKLSIRLRCSRPELSNSGDFHLHSARHPLLEIYIATGHGGKDDRSPESVVPLDITLGDKFDALVITGPNTGGKTVALKTVGILHLMVQSGIPIPADEGSRLGIFEDIFADIGDEQSLESNLSTFSSHIANIITILSMAGSRSLVLLDELGVGTDPEEGIALSIEVIRHLLENDVKILSTTHFGAIKAFAQKHPRIENASMEFDPEKLQPTYRLRIGIPGSSYGIMISSKLGMPEEITRKAISSLGTDNLRTDRLIQRLEKKIREEEEVVISLEREKSMIEKMKADYRHRFDEVEKRERALKKRASKEVLEIVDAYRKKLEHVVAEIRKSGAERESIKSARNTILRVREEVEKQLAPDAEIVADEEIYWPMEGEVVLVESLKSRGVVNRIDRNAGVIQVQINNKKIDVAAGSIRPLSGEEAGKIPVRVMVHYDTPETISPEIDLRGSRVDEITTSLDRYIDQALLSGLSSVRIIHGKGSGRLREKVRELLRKDSRVTDFRLGEWNEGGDGVTIVTLIP